MAKINLLPWRDALREKRKKEFIAYCVGAALVGVLAVALAWFFYSQKLEDQRTSQSVGGEYQSKLRCPIKVIGRSARTAQCDC